MKDRRGKTLDQEIIKRVLLPCMDYLHGDVVDGQFRAACHYEYSRESNILRKAAELFKCSVYPEEITFKIENEFHCGFWFIQHEWSFIWQCPSFPAKSWNQLSEKERSELLCGLPLSTNKPRPLVLGEVMFLTHYLDKLKQIADTTRAQLKEAVAAGRSLPQKICPILELPNTPFVQVLLPLDFRKSKKRLLKEIDLWLQLPENKVRFTKHELKTEADTEKQSKDRLKDLAAWRLYRELGSKEALAFAEKNRQRDKHGKPRRFHDARKEQSKTKMPLNEAPLYSEYNEESGFLKAKARALKYRAELLPWEFGKYAEEREQQRREWAAAFKKALKEVKKISKSSS